MRTNNNAPLYVGGGVFIVTMIGCIVLLILRPGDNSFVILLAFAGPVLTTLLANKTTNDKVDQAVAEVKEGNATAVKTHDLVNSKSLELLQAAKIIAEATGYAKAMQDQKDANASKATGHAEGVAAEKSDQAFRDEGVITHKGE